LTLSTSFFLPTTPLPQIHTLSLHDALPIFAEEEVRERILKAVEARAAARTAEYGVDVMRYVEKAILLQTLDHHWREHIVDLDHLDRKSTRLNSSHDQISYAVFCLKKKNK